MTGLAYAALLAALIHLHVRVSRQEKRMETLEQKIAKIENVTTTLGTAVSNVVAELKAQTGAPTEDQLSRLDRIADALTGDVASLTPTDAHDATTTPPTDTIPAGPAPTNPDGDPASTTLPGAGATNDGTPVDEAAAQSAPEQGSTLS